MVGGSNISNGRVLHVVYFSYCRFGRFPPVVRTAVPVDGRFEHIVLSCNVTVDHAIIWIEKESQKALDVSFQIFLMECWVVICENIVHMNLLIPLQVYFQFCLA